MPEVLDGMNAEYEILDGTRANIYSDVQVTKLVTGLLERNCIVNSMKEHDENLESFYMNLVGGERNE